MESVTGKHLLRKCSVDLQEIITLYRSVLTTYFWRKHFKSVSHSVVSDPATPWTIAHQAPLPMEFSKQECWSG